VSFVLVVVAAITLVIGLLQSGLAIIYVSIACSVLAGIVLATAVLRGRPEPRGAGAPMPQRATAGAPPAAAPNTWVAPGQTTTEIPAPAAAPEPVTAGASAGALGGGVAVAERGDRTESFDRVEIDEGPDPYDDFPIHGYDKLRATEILPMLAELSDDQLTAVDERERAGKNRAMVLKRIEVQKQSRAAEPEPEPEAEPEAWDADDEGWEDAAAAAPAVSREPEPEPAPELEPEPGLRGGPMAGRPVAPAVGEFPIPDYDDLKALEVLGRLPDLSVTELHLVRRREEDGFRRAMVLNRVDRLIEEAPPEPEPIVVVPPKRSSRTRAATTKAPPAKRSAATRSPVIKKARAVAVAPPIPAKRTRTAKAATPVPAKKAATTRKASASTRKAVAESKSVAARKVAAPRKAVPAKRGTKKR